MASQPSRTLTPRILGETIFRHKKKIALCPLLAITLGTLVILYYPRTYRSQAQVFLRLGRESVGLDPTATTGQTISMQQGDRKDEVKSVLEVVKTRGVIAQVVDRLGPEVVLGDGQLGEQTAPSGSLRRAAMAPLNAVFDAVRSIDPVSDRERAIVLVERHLYVGAERGSTLIEIAYEAKSPQLAQTVCAAMIDIFQQEHMRIQRSDGSRLFFADQQDRLRQQLDGALQALREAKNEMGLVDNVDRRGTLEAQFSAVELDRLTTEQQLTTSQARTADLQRQLTQVPERVVASHKSVPNVGADLLRDRLYGLEVISMELQARYTDAHPRVHVVNEQLKEAEGVLATQSGERMETTDDINPIFRELSLALKQERSVQAGLAARLTKLEQQKKTVLADLRGLNDHELKVDELNRTAELTREKYFQYAKNLEEARIDKELENERISNLSIVQAATLAEQPVSPSKPLVALATLLLATAGTASIVIASEWCNDRLRSEADTARELELPVLASIPGDRAHRRVPRMTTNGTAQHTTAPIP